MYANVDQLINKRDALCMTISNAPPDIIFLTECIPKAQRLPVSPALLDVPGFSLYTNFSLSRYNLGATGIRGICVFVKEGIKVTEIAFIEAQIIEQLWVKVKLKGTDYLLAGCIYRSPSANPAQSVDELTSIFHAVLTNKPSHLLICGDFNFPQVDWLTHFCTAHESHITHRFLNLVQDCLLYQHVTQPTRYREGDTPSTLDLLLTNEDGMLTSLEYQPGIG